LPSQHISLIRRACRECAEIDRKVDLPHPRTDGDTTRYPAMMSELVTSCSGARLLSSQARSAIEVCFVDALERGRDGRDAWRLRPRPACWPSALCATHHAWPVLVWRSRVPKGRFGLSSASGLSCDASSRTGSRRDGGPRSLIERSPGCRLESSAAQARWSSALLALQDGTYVAPSVGNRLPQTLSQRIRAPSRACRRIRFGFLDG